MKLFIFLSIFSISAFAQNILWSEIDFDHNLKIDQKIILSEDIQVNISDELLVKDIVPLDYIRVLLFQFELLSCKDHNLATEMSIVDINASRAQVQVGVQLAKDCILEVFIETKDINTLSPFQIL